MLDPTPYLLQEPGFPDADRVCEAVRINAAA
jgi:hypothetical protein